MTLNYNDCEKLAAATGLGSVKAQELLDAVSGGESEFPSITDDGEAVTVANGVGVYVDNLFLGVEGGSGSIQSNSATMVTVDASDTLHLTAQGSLGGGVVVASLNNKLRFHGGAPIAKQTGVAVTAEAIHAALVALGLFDA